MKLDAMNPVMDGHLCWYLHEKTPSMAQLEF